MRLWSWWVEAGRLGKNRVKEAIKTFVFSTLPFTNSRPSLRKVGFWFIFVDVFISDQKRFGFSNSESLSLVTWTFFFFEIICLVWCLSCRNFSISVDAFVFSAFFLCLFFFFMSVRSSVSIHGWSDTLRFVHLGMCSLTAEEAVPSRCYAICWYRLDKRPDPKGCAKVVLSAQANLLS